MITIKFTDLVKHLNPSMKQLREDEKRTFKTQKEVYRFLVGKYGSSVFSCVEVFEDNKKVSYWNLKVK